MVYFPRQDWGRRLPRLYLLHLLWLEDELLHAPGFDLSDDDLVGVAAIHHVDDLQSAEFLAGMTELADDGPVQFHLVDFAGDRPRAGHISVGIGVGSEKILVRSLGNAGGPADTDLVVDSLWLEVVVEDLVADVGAV